MQNGASIMYKLKVKKAKCFKTISFSPRLPMPRRAYYEMQITPSQFTDNEIKPLIYQF